MLETWRVILQTGPIQLKPYFPSCNKYFPVQICGWDVTIISQFRFMDERYQLFPNLNLRIRCNNDFPIQMCGWDVKIFPNTNLWILSMESMRWTNYEWERLQIGCRLIQITFRAKSAWLYLYTYKYIYIYI